MNVSIEEALQLRQQGKHRSALKAFLKLEKIDPSQGEISYQIASTYDNLGHESLAIPYYQKAIRQGLKTESLLGAYVGLGSSLRAMGHYKKALAIFKLAKQQFSDQKIFIVFEAMTLYNLHQSEKAMKKLLFLLTEYRHDSSIQMYQKAIRFYANKLTKKFR